MAEVSEPQIATVVAFGREYRLVITRFTTTDAAGAPETIEQVCVYLGDACITMHVEYIR